MIIRNINDKVILLITGGLWCLWEVIDNFNPCTVIGQVKSLIHDYDQNYESHKS